MSASLTVNGKTINARDGETLLNAAIAGGIVIPHDCMTGQCDTCMVSLMAGELDGAPVGADGGYLACQSRVKGAARIAFEEMPAVAKWKGEVTSITPMAADVWEVAVELGRSVPYLPGQYVNLTFGSLPERAFSPTLGLDLERGISQLIFHIRSMPGGAVSGQLGKKIVKGTRVQVRGPFGHAWLRRAKNRLVFISSGTGWAPIWSMAVAARLGQPDRDMVVVTGARLTNRLYMAAALDWLRTHDAGTVIACASDGDGAQVLRGRAADHIPDLRSDDIVHVAGPKSLVDAVLARAQAVGAQCYTDPFERVDATPTVGGRFSKLLGRFGLSRQQLAPQAS
jgi:naphthalene 1,2-dioxygenase ferredoxin reductase component